MTWPHANLLFSVDVSFQKHISEAKYYLQTLYNLIFRPLILAFCCMQLEAYFAVML